MPMVRKLWGFSGSGSPQPVSEGGAKNPGKDGWKPAGVRLVLSGQGADSSGRHALLGSATTNLADEPFDPKDLLEIEVDVGSSQAGPAAADREYDLALLALVTDDQVKQALLADILKQRHGLSDKQLKREDAVEAFQVQRTALMTQAVTGAKEVNSHLVTWNRLAQFVVPPLITATVIATLLLMFRLLPLVSDKKITGLELALLFFVLALVAVSPVTLLLIGRPLKGLDDWSPGKTADEPPAAGDGAAAGTTPEGGAGSSTG